MIERRESGWNVEEAHTEWLGDETVRRGPGSVLATEHELDLRRTRAQRKPDCAGELDTALDMSTKKYRLKDL